MKKSEPYCVEHPAEAMAALLGMPSDALQNAIQHRDQSIKADGNKLRMELIPTSALISLGRVLTHGAEKYSPNSWQNVEYERYIGALIRHLVAFIDDPNGVDSDSGLKHTEHLLANAVFLNDAVMKGRVPVEKPTTLA